MTDPRHVALIIDGNRRWARRQGLPFVVAYREAGENLVATVLRAVELGIETVTAFLFSTENWRRDQAEINAVMTAFEAILYTHAGTFEARGVRVHTIGDVCALPASTQVALARAKTRTAGGNSNFVMAFNYGGRWDLLQAARRLSGLTSQAGVTEAQLAGALSTAPFGDPDLLIRTGGERRISNFMLWQLAYTELYFSELMWPDFQREQFERALYDYRQRERRLGGC